MCSTHYGMFPFVGVIELWYLKMCYFKFASATPPKVLKGLTSNFVEVIMGRCRCACAVTHHRMFSFVGVIQL